MTVSTITPEFIKMYLEGAFEDITTFARLYTSSIDNPIMEVYLRTLSSVKYRFDWITPSERTSLLDTFTKHIPDESTNIDALMMFRKMLSESGWHMS